MRRVDQQEEMTCSRCGGPRESWESYLCYGCAGQDSIEIIEAAGVEPGDRVEYDGREWTLAEQLEWHLTLLIADDGTEEWGVDIRELTLVESGEDR